MFHISYLIGNIQCWIGISVELGYQSKYRHPTSHILLCDDTMVDTQLTQYVATTISRHTSNSTG
jgi:hypothetical protein